MSTAPKTGHCRIPTFASRIPHIRSHAAASQSQPTTAEFEITAKNLGSRARAGDKEGILRFVGPVHFAQGAWGGLELTAPVGKNDGSVGGVRYFACSARCGLMAPLAKLALIDDRCASASDNDSGPYSILFLDSKHQDTYVKNEIDTNSTVLRGEAASANRNGTFDVLQEDNATFNVTKPLEQTFKKPREPNITLVRNPILNDTKAKEVLKDNGKKRTNETFDSPFKSPTVTHSNTRIDINVNLTYKPNEKSSQELLQDTSVEVKRRRTSSSSTKSHDKPSSLPHLRSSLDNLDLNFTVSTPMHRGTKEPLFRKQRISSIHQVDQRNLNDDDSKRDSLELDESLGLLTPYATRSPSLEYEVNIDELFQRTKNIPSHKEPLSPNVTSVTDFSLGIIDEQILSNLTMKTNTTMNMELPLDSVDKSLLARIEQTPSPEELPLDPTPSDPKTEPSKSKASSFISSITSLDTGYQGDGEMSRPASRGADSPLTRRPLPRPQARRPDPMTDSDFYTESDADNHEENPLRGDRKAQVIDGTLYGVDPQAAADIYANNRENMDSSGIFTDIEGNTRADVSPSDTSSKTISENSQDNVKEVVDKTLVTDSTKENPKKRNAPSPGVSSPSSFSSPRHVAKEENIAKKYKMPKRDVASKVKAMMEPARVQPEKKTVKKPAGRWDAVMSKISKNEQTVPKKEIKSKVFNNININTGVLPRPSESKKPATRTSTNQKPQNNKLSVVPCEMSASSPNLRKSASDRVNPKVPLGQTVTPVKRPGSAQSLPSSEKRRIRNRPNSGTSVKTVGGSNVGSSIHSSLSDLSAATLPPTKKTGSAKKRTEVVQVTQVLTANKLSPRTQQRTAAENKKNATLHSSPSIDAKTKRTIFSPKDKKPILAKECGRGTAKGGRTSPSVRPPPQPRVPTVKQPPVAEALAVLVQHLVFNVGAYQVPTLRRQLEKYRSENEEIRLACQHLEEALAQEKTLQARAIEEERIRSRGDIAELIEQHRIQIAELTKEHVRLEQCLSSEKENAQQHLFQQHEDRLVALKTEFDRLQRTHEESLDILREENESIREQITEKQQEILRTQAESRKLLDDYESKEVHLKEHNRRLGEKLDLLEGDFEQRLKGLVEENRRLRDDNDRLLSYGDDKGIGVQEVQSLRAVLELKQNELAELRKIAAEATQKADILVGAEEKARVLNARCEDLQLQLQRKADHEKLLIQDKLKLQESFKEESNQKKRLSQHNEELQWKLKQNKEVITKVLEQAAEETAFNRSTLSSSFNERHSSSRLSLERTLSFRDRAYSNRSTVSLEESVRSRRKSKNSAEYDVADDVSPPASPKVKAVVEKSDSVSYVLEMDESPDVVADRIVRRSFRNATTTPTKNNTPTRNGGGGGNKRPRMRTPLSQSASSSAILSANKSDPDSPRSGVSSRDGDWADQDVFSWPADLDGSVKYGERLDANYESSGSSGHKPDRDDPLDLDEEEEDEDLRLPALPSELAGRRGGARVLPSPKLLAGEAMVSESNSEDESTSSSQL